MVRTGLVLVSVPWPPTNGSFGFPAPFSPWHDWHFCVYTTAPWSGVPLPGGSPVPSGGILMSHPAISAGVAGRPRLGVSWATLDVEAARARSTITTAVTLRVDIFHLTGSLYLPRLDGIVVKDGVRAMRADQGVARRLDGASVVSGTALEHSRGTVPLPGGAEARH